MSRMVMAGIVEKDSTNNSRSDSNIWQTANLTCAWHLVIANGRCTHGCYDTIEHSLLTITVCSMGSSYEKICIKQNYQCS